MKHYHQSLNSSMNMVSTIIVIVLAVFALQTTAYGQEPQPTPPQRRVQPVDASGLGTPLMMMMNQDKDSLEMFSYADMTSSPNVVKKLIIKEIPPLADLCTDPLTIKKAVLNARLKMGAIDYEFDRLEGLQNNFSSFNATATVTFTGYSTQTNTLPVVFTYTCTLNIQSGDAPTLVEPEQLWHQDFTEKYSAIDHINVTVTFTHNYNGVSDLEIALKNATIIETWYTDEFTSKIENAVDPTKPMIALVPLANTVSDNPVTFKWDLSTECPNDKFYNYQFQLLRLFNRDLAKAIAKVETDIIDTIDWSHALTIETGSYKKEITLTIPEGRGYYVWRVRPIGSEFPGGIADDRNWGVWTKAPANGRLAIADVDKSNISDPDHKNAIFFYNGFDRDKNWIYSRTFTEGEEGTRVSEKITYATSLLQPVQTQTHLQSKNERVVTQSVLDYSGRPAVSSLPVPIVGNGFSYQSALLKNSSSLYTAANFDKNSTVDEPQAINAGLLYEYYSDDNSDLSVPNAEGYGYTRTMWYPDASGRVREQSSVGKTHRKKIDNPTDPSRTVRYWYAQPSDEELIAMFGDEAPEANAVQRVAVKDANGVISVKYVGKDGVMLATALSKNKIANSANLSDLPTDAGSPNTSDRTKERFYEKMVSDTVKTKTLRGEHEIAGGKVIQLLAPSPITVQYQITPQTIELECGNYCATCDYEVEFRLFNTDDLGTVKASFTYAIPGNVANCPNPQQPQLLMPPVTFLAQDPGTYLVERIIRPKKDANGQDWIENHSENARQAVLAQLNANTAFTTIKQKLTENKLDEVWAYLYAAHRTPNSGVTEHLNAEGAIISYTLTTPCCTLEIPYRTCTDPDECPTNNYYTSNTNLDFEQMLYDRWGPPNYKYGTSPNTSDFGDNPAKYFRRDGSALFPSANPYSNNNGKGAFNQLIKNMLADGYNCRKIYDTWMELVMNFGTLATKNGDGNPNDLKDDFDLLETFLLRTGRMLEGVSNHPYGEPSANEYNKGYITHAHRFFELHNNNNDGLSECQALYNGGNPLLNGPDQGGHYTPVSPAPWSADKLDDDISKSDKKHWERFYRCFTQKGDKPKSLENKIPCDEANETCINKYKKAIEDTCAATCERRYKSFIRSIERAYREVGQTPEGDKYTPTGEIVDSLTVVVPRAKIECQALTLVAECKEGCTLTITRDSETNKITGVGTESEANAMRKAMYYSYRVSIPNGPSCPDSMEIIRGTDSMAWGRYMVRVLNDSLRRYRERGGDTNTATFTCQWIRTMLIEMFGEDNCHFDWDCDEPVTETMIRANAPTTPAHEKTKNSQLLSSGGCPFGANPPCPSEDFPYLFALDSTITGEFVFDDCAVAYIRTCIKPGYEASPCIKRYTICHDVCKGDCADSICFTWVPLHAPDTGTILRPVLCAERVCKQLLTDINQQIANCLDKAEADIAQQYQTNCRLPESLQDRMIIQYNVGLYHFDIPPKKWIGS